MGKGKLNEDQQMMVSCGVAGCCVMILAVIIFFALAIKNIAHDEYALQYDTYSRELIDDEPLTEGRKFTSIYISLFIYPAKSVTTTIEGLQCYTNDGVTITTNIDVIYTLNGAREKLEYIFWNFGEFNTYKNHIDNSIATELRDKCTGFDATDFPNIRGSIELNMESALQSFFEADNNNIRVTKLQLKNYSFPKALDDAITNKQKSIQGIDNALNKRQGEVTKAETRLGTAEIKAQSIDIQASIKRNTIINTAKAQANSVKALWENRKTVYILNKNSFNLTPEEFIESYLRGTILRNTKNLITSI